VSDPEALSTGRYLFTMSISTGLFFPRSIAPKEVLDYNVAKEVERMLASDKAD